MTKLYQILNDQFQPVKMFESLDEAQRHIYSLREVYDESFYVVELPVVFSSTPAHSRS